MKKRTVVFALSSILFLSGTAFGNGSTSVKQATSTRVKPELTAGYKTKISAIFAALNHISSFNKGYEIVKGANGLYYVRLLTDETYKISRI